MRIFFVALGEHRGDHDHVIGERVRVELPLRPLKHEMVGKHDQIVAERLRPPERAKRDRPMFAN
jgi:hypothetical protein